mmetsp:Transcript_25333/g.36763  ORF Transcript_25333/g.36763 Transcript_25333/m.36763 type:complete len:333 (+) Transcript_25333:189-1187(+)
MLKATKIKKALVLACILLSGCHAIQSPSSSLQTLTVRGGAKNNNLNDSFLEYNPSYQGTTLGDLEQRNFIPTANNNHQQMVSYQNTPSSRYTSSSQPKPMTQIISDFMSKLHSTSPLLHNGLLTILVLFLAWQIPSFMPLLRNHFVCSRYNILQKKRLHALVLSTLSHATFTHLALNMYAFITFGLSTQQILQRCNLPIWPFVVGAAITGSLTFLLANPQGSCIGLSGVTLAMLAFNAMNNPSKELGFVIYFVPIRLAAQHALTLILCMSVLGTLGQRVGSAAGGNVAHATHLGGLLFGIGYYEALRREWLTRYRPRCLRWVVWKRWLGLVR